MEFIIELELRSPSLSIDPETDFDSEFDASISAMKNFCNLFGFKLVDYSSALGDVIPEFIFLRNAFFNFSISKKLKPTEIVTYTSAVRAFTHHYGFTIHKEDLDLTE